MRCRPTLARSSGGQPWGQAACRRSMPRSKPTSRCSSSVRPGSIQCRASGRGIGSGAHSRIDSTHVRKSDEEVSMSESQLLRPNTPAGEPYEDALRALLGEWQASGECSQSGKTLILALATKISPTRRSALLQGYERELTAPSSRGGPVSQPISAAITFRGGAASGGVVHLSNPSRRRCAAQDRGRPIRFPLWLRQAEDLLHERGIDISHETLRAWRNRFGPLFAAEIRLKRSASMRGWSPWRGHLDEVFVRINGEIYDLWRAGDHEGEALESFVTKKRDRQGQCAETRAQYAA